MITFAFQGGEPTLGGFGIFQKSSFHRLKMKRKRLRKFSMRFRQMVHLSIKSGVSSFLRISFWLVCLWMDIVTES
jgi:hypothetical protein